MFGHQWKFWINNPTSGSIPATSAKQEQETSSDCLGKRRKATCHRFCLLVGLSALCVLLLVTCAALSVLYNRESDSRPEWKNFLFDYQNISDGHLALTEANYELRRDNEVLQEQSDFLRQQAELLNRTSAKLTSVNLALSLESAELMEQIVNLTSTNLQLRQEHERLVQQASEQEETKTNMSETIERLQESETLREEEGRRLSQANELLKDELLQVREKNQELLEINDKFQEEVKNLSERVEALLNDREEASVGNVQLREKLQTLNITLQDERQEAAEQEETRRDEMDRMMADFNSTKEAYRSLNNYCPVVNHKTKERLCTKCPDGWRLFENKCYYFSSRTLTWSSSRSWCQTQGGDLLVINSEPEQSFIFESSRALQQGGSRLWIGMTDAQQEGHWLWVDGSPVTSENQYWLSRPGLGTEPDDWKLDDPLGEDCGHIDTHENALKSWMDGSCQLSYRWICEKKL